MTFLHYVSLHLEEPNPSGRPPLDREWSWLLLQLRDAESEVWMLLGSWSRAMYRGFYRLVPWATNYRDTHRVIGTLRTCIFFFAQKNMLLQFTFVYVPAEICGHQKIIILLCLRQKTVPKFTFVYVPANICGHQKIILLLCLRQKTVPKFLRLFVFLHFFRNTKLITHIWWKTVPL